MNAQLFDMQLASQLGDDIASPGINGVVFTYAQRCSATNWALKEYSRFRRFLKLFGTGYTYAPITAGATSFLMTGGGYVANEQIILEPNTSNAETVTVQSVSQGQPTVSGTTISPSGLSLVQLTAPCVNNHAAGVYLQQVTPGMHLIAGQYVYQLPYDFIEIDQNTFDIAIGMKAPDWNQYYDASYIFAMQLTSLGMGYSADYGLNNPYGYAIFGDPYDNPDGLQSNTTPTGGAMIPDGFKFYYGAEPQLIIGPAPSSNTIMVPWQYYSSHCVATIPESDTDTIIGYAAYRAFTMYGFKRIVASPDRKIGNATYSESKSLEFMNKTAESWRRDFDRNIRLRPFITSG